MISETVIHVGLHKTATTFLQREVFPQLSDISLVTRPYTQHNHAFNQMQYADESLYDAEKVSKELEKISSDGRRLLLSDESFSGKPVTFNYINRSIIASRLKKLLPQSTIILFIRGQVDIIYSHYNQYVKTGGTKHINNFVWRSKEEISFDTFCKHRKNIPMDTLYYNTNCPSLHIDNFKYFEIIDLYKRLFHRVEVLLYEDLVNEPRRIALRLSEVFKQPVDVTVPDHDRVNRSINSFYLSTVRMGSRFEAVFGTRYIGAAARYLPAKAPFWYNYDKYYNNIQKIVGTYYVNSNRRLIERYPDIGIQKYPNKYFLG